MRSGGAPYGNEPQQAAPFAPTGYSSPGSYPKAAEYSDDGYYPTNAPALNVTNVEYRQVKIIKTHEGPVHAVAMSSTGRLATASWDKTVHIYDLTLSDEEALVASIPRSDDTQDYAMEEMGGLYDVDFSNIAPHIIGVASSDGNAYIWNHETGEKCLTLADHSDEVNGVTFHPTQQVCCTSSDDGTTKVWDFQDGSLLRTLDAKTRQVYSATFLGFEREHYVAATCFDSKVRIWDMRSQSCVETLETHCDDVIGADYCPRMQTLATGSDDGSIVVWDARRWQEPMCKLDTRMIPGLASNEVKRVRWSVDGLKIAAGCSSQQVLVYDFSRGGSAQLFAQLPGHQECVFDVVWGVDGTTGTEYLVDASHDHLSFVWKPVK
jgi:WD40 repeat protein